MEAIREIECMYDYLVVECRLAEYKYYDMDEVIESALKRVEAEGW